MAAAMTDTMTFEALRACVIMDTPNESAFDHVTAAEAHLCRAPVSLLTFIDMDRMWVRSSYGTDPIELPRLETFCTHTSRRPNWWCLTRTRIRGLPPILSSQVH